MSSPEEDLKLQIVERAMSGLSLLGCLFITITFAFWPAFRKPINRLIFWASLGNILCNVATLIATSALPSQGGNPALCKFQGFFIQMFMPADSMWTFCMALNVHLTFFNSYNVVDLRALEKWYFLACYGLPLIPALMYLIIDEVAQKGIYGSAILWCWVSTEWDWMRIAFFYGPVWLIIVLTLGIYVRVGKVISKRRAELRAWSRSVNDPVPLVDNPFSIGSASTNSVTRVTQIEVTSEPRASPSDNTALGTIHENDHSNRTDSTRADSPRSSFGSESKLNAQHTHHENISGQGFNQTAYPYSAHVSATQEARQASVASAFAGNQFASMADLESNLCPTSAERKTLKVKQRLQSAAWGYAKVSFLMFVAMCVIWIPSSANRMWSLAHHNQSPPFSISIVAAAVLPMQGFWNCMIYVMTSFSQCRSAYSDTISALKSAFCPRKKAEQKEKEKEKQLAQRIADHQAQARMPMAAADQPRAPPTLALIKQQHPLGFIDAMDMDVDAIRSRVEADQVKMALARVGRNGRSGRAGRARRARPSRPASVDAERVCEDS